MNQGTRLFLRASLLIIPILATGSCRAREKKTTPAMAVSPAPTQLPEDQDVASRAPRGKGLRPPVIWLGLDGLDWELLDRLAAEGRLPNWKRLTSEGWSARLAAFSPLLSPLLWTSAATGVPPDVHRVLDFQEVDPKSGRKVPISGESRAVPAVWNLASAAGRKVGVVGWWATHPAEEVNGFFVSDRASPLLFAKLPLAGVVFPTGLKGGVETVIERSGRVAADELARFLDVPAMEIAKSLSESERASGRTRDPVAGLARIVGATRVSHRIARDLYDRNLPDLLALYLEGTDEVGHLFAAYTPPKLDCVTDADSARYRRVVETYYGMVDGILGQWMRRAAEDGATLLVHSDHGFKWGADRPCGFGSASWATAAFWHRPNGVIAAWGTKVRPAQRRVDANLLDVAPTVLALLGLPADYRMPGVPRSDAFRALPRSARADVFPKVAVRRVAAGSTTRDATSEYVSKLIALGYLSPSETRPLAPSGGNRPGMTEGAWNNLGVYFRDTVKKSSAARDAFAKSLALRRDYHSALFNMAVLERQRGDPKAAEKWFFRSVVAVGGDPAAAILAWSADAQKAGDGNAARSALEKGLHSYPKNEEIARALALFRQRAGDCRAAVDVLAPFEAEARSARTLNALALFQTCLRNRPEVVRLLERSLALDPNQPDVARSLAAARGAG